MKKVNDLFETKLKVLNIGLRDFSENIRRSNGLAVQMNWKPPAGGDTELMEIIRKIKAASRKDSKE